MAEKIPHWQSHTFLRAFLWKDGEEGCEICEDAEVKISLDRPPPLGDSPKSVLEQSQKAEKDQQRDDSGKFLNVLFFPWAIAREIRKARAWAATPEPPKPAKPTRTVTVKVSRPVFDIQQIPSIMRSKLGRPMGAAMLEKWFAADLNFARSRDGLDAEINQRGEPYPPGMFDRYSIKMKWVLEFERAKRAFNELVINGLMTDRASNAIRKSLHPYRHQGIVDSSIECCGDIRRMHRDFQFQFAKVDGNLSEKIAQFATQEVLHRGLPDELTFVLGSFSIYAAVGRAVFQKIDSGTIAKITHINLYVRDSFDFLDGYGETSQYLGHWGERGLSILPVAQMPGLRDLVETSDYSRGIRIDRWFWYSVRNSDFRKWQQKHQRGGDYFIYTDYISRMLPQPISVIIPDSYGQKI